MEPSRKRMRVAAIDVMEWMSGASGFGGGVVQQPTTASSSDYTIKSAAKDIVELQEINVAGKYIKLANTSTDKVT